MMIVNYQTLLSLCLMTLLKIDLEELTRFVRDFRDEKLCDRIEKVPYTGKIHYSDTINSTQQCGL